MHVLLYTLFIQLIGILYLVWRGGRAMPRGWWRRLLRGVLLADLLFVLVVILLRHQLSSALLTFSIVFVYSWAFVLLYTVPLVLLINGGRLLYKHITGQMARSRLSDRGYQRAKWVLLFATVAISAILMIYDYQQAATPYIAKHKVELAKPLGAGREHLRVLFVSGLHFSEMIGRPFAERLVELYKKIVSDLMLVGGNTLDYYPDPAYLDSIPEIIQQITSPLSCHYVLGSYEYRSDMAKKKAWIKLVGGTFLMDSIATPGGVVTLIGRDDYTQRGRTTPSELVGQIPQENQQLPRILFEYQPRQLDSLASNNIDLALYGHTHDKQIFPLTLLVRAYYPMAHGLTERYGTPVYVSSGYGTAGPATRLFTNSEVVVFDLYSISKQWSLDIADHVTDQYGLSTDSWRRGCTKISAGVSH